MNARLIRSGIVTASVLAGGLLAVVAFNSVRWVGTTFPGFFVLANRVVPSSSLPNWGIEVSRIFQHQILAVDGAPVTSASAVYAKVAQQPAGTLFHYTLRAPDGTVTTEVVQSRRFAFSDYVLIFGSFLLCGVTFMGTALLVLWLRPNGSATFGLLALGLGVGLFALTAVDVYGPHWFFRLHVLAEALLPAGAIHLALVFPTDRLRQNRQPILLAVYLPFLLLAILYECVLDWPSAYTAVHLTASVGHGLCCLAVIAAVAYDRFTTESALLRSRIGVVGAGAVTAFIGPMIINGASGLLGGSVPVNGTALTAFIFPLSLGYALLKRDLLDTDMFREGLLGNVLQRGAAASSPLSSWLLWCKAPLTSLARWLEAANDKRLVQRGVVGAALVAAALVAIVAVNSTRWIGTAFPGFLLMHNRVVPSISLPGWDANLPGLFQNEVIAVDGVEVNSVAAVYEHVRGKAVGTMIQYTLHGPDGATRTEAARSRRFSAVDYASLFGSFLLTGSAFLLVGLLVFYLHPRSWAGQGLLSAGVIGGVFVITAVDLYGPHWFFRLHVVAEALVPASLIHLALVFPTNRLRRAGMPLITGIYLICGALAVVYELVLYWPVTYSAVHLLASTAQGIGGLLLIWMITYDLLTTRSTLVRRRILVAALGTVAAFVVPAILMAASGLRDGSVPVNASALTGFLFPLSFGYAIAKRDLLKIDVFLYQVAVVLVAITTSTYFTVLSGLAVIRTRLQ